MPASTVRSNDFAKAHTIAAGVEYILPGIEGATVHIKTGTTANVYTTLDTPAAIAAGTADWFPWTDGSKAGPWIGKVVGKCNAIKITSVAGGTVFVSR
jgi:hypothetical protein